MKERKSSRATPAFDVSVGIFCVNTMDFSAADMARFSPAVRERI